MSMEFDIDFYNTPILIVRVPQTLFQRKRLGILLRGTKL